MLRVRGNFAAATFTAEIFFQRVLFAGSHIFTGSARRTCRGLAVATARTESIDRFYGRATRNTGLARRRNEFSIDHHIVVVHIVKKDDFFRRDLGHGGGLWAVD